MESGPPPNSRWIRVQARVAARALTRSTRTRWDALLARLSQLGVDENALLLTFAAVVGLASAAGVVLFYRAIDAFHFVLFEWPESLMPNVPIAFSRPFLTAITFVCAATLWRRVGRG